LVFFPHNLILLLEALRGEIVLLQLPPLIFAGKFHGDTMLKKYEGEAVVEVHGTHVQDEKYVQKY